MHACHTIMKETKCMKVCSVQCVVESVQRRQVQVGRGRNNGRQAGFLHLPLHSTPPPPPIPLPLSPWMNWNPVEEDGRLRKSSQTQE